MKTKRAAAAAPITFNMTKAMIGPSKLDTQAMMAISLHEKAMFIDGDDDQSYSATCLLGAVLAVGDKRERIVSVTKLDGSTRRGEPTDVLTTDKGTTMPTAKIVRVKTYTRLFTVRGNKVVATKADVTRENSVLKRFMGEQPLISVGQQLSNVNVKARRARANKTSNSNEIATMTKTAKPVAKKVAAKKVVGKQVRAKKPVAVVRSSRMTNDQRQALAVAQFALRKKVSGLISTHLIENDEKIVTHIDQPEVKAVLGRKLFIRDAWDGKLVQYGIMEHASADIGAYDLGLMNIYTVFCDDAAFPLHQIRKEGTKFVFDRSIKMPNKRQTVLVAPVDFDKPRASKTANSKVSPRKQVAREEDNQRLGYTAAAEKNAELRVVKGELKPSDLPKGAAIIIDESIRGDKVKQVKILTEGKGTARSPFIRRRYVFTEKGQKCPLAEMRILRGKLRAL